jgi:hypothetical protein
LALETPKITQLGLVPPAFTSEYSIGAPLEQSVVFKIAVWLVIAMVLFTVFKQFDRAARWRQVGYSEFLMKCATTASRAPPSRRAGGTEVVATTTDDRKIRTTATYLDRGLVGDLINNNVKFDVKPREEQAPAQHAVAGVRCCC